MFRGDGSDKCSISEKTEQMEGYLSKRVAATQANEFVAAECSTLERVLKRGY